MLIFFEINIEKMVKILNYVKDVFCNIKITYDGEIKSERNMRNTLVETFDPGTETFFT